MRSTPVTHAPRALLLAACLLASSCAQERAPINRVQPNAIPKSFFVGVVDDPSDDPEFYYRASLVDVASGAGGDGLFTNTDSQPTTRIRWEITEKTLIARLTYELVEDTDHKGARRTPDGQAVAAFNIETHLDIRRDYNSSTGEEYNVLVENTTDRPWYQRDYLRVDWSKNLVTDAYDLDALSQLGVWYGIKWEPLSYYVNDPNNPDAPVFDTEHGYFDVTTKVWAAPQMVHDDWWGDFPACWLYGSHFPTENCNPSEVTFRHSFKKVVDTDYEPLAYDGAQMDLFGYFTVDRFGYDRRYGVVDDRWHRFATRWNLYEKSHADQACAVDTTTTPVGKSVHRDEDGDGTEDECASVGRGSRCDEFRGQCTLPLRDRKLKTIVWHVNPGFPEDLFQSTKDALMPWSEALRVAVLAGRMAECRHSKETNCERQMLWPSNWTDEYSPPIGSDGPSQVPQIFTLCHNPVDSTKGDDPLCGKDGTAPRLGDLRYNFISVIQDPQQTSPWGIMMDAEDPLTGEKIAGSVNEWGAVLDRAASTLVDLMGLINGEIDPSGYIVGQNVSDWVQANQPGGTAERGAALSLEELASRKGAFDPKSLAPLLSGLDKRAGKVHPHLRHKERAKALSDSGRLGPGNTALSERLQRLRGSGVEAMLVNPMMAQAAGYDPTGPISPSAIERASPFGRFSPVARREQAKAKLLHRAKRHSCLREAPEADSLLGLARYAKTRFPAPDPADPEYAQKLHAHRTEVWNWGREQFNKGVLAHELGHSMGLRHNFAASFDSLNYATGYWQLRTKNGTVNTPCADGATDGSSCIGPRWKDPVSQDEIDGNIGHYATTSVMDYPGDSNQDMLVAGKYDRAAVRFGYGQAVDVWAGKDLSVTGGGAGQATAYELSAFTTSPGLFGVYYFPPVDPTKPYEFIHYSQYGQKFGLLQGCKDEPDPAKAVLGKKCSDATMDVVDYRDMKDFASDPAYAAYSWAVNSKAVDGQGRVRRGYMFSSDEYADSGNVPSFTTDAGADAYEQIRFLEGMYENRYILDAFRRNRVQFDSWDVTDRIQYRYLDPIQQIAKTFAFAAVLDGDPTAPSAGFLDDGYYGPLGLGATLSLDLFARILTRPEPGMFCDTERADCPSITPYGTDPYVYMPDSTPLPAYTQYAFRVGLGDGRYLHNDFDYSKGYWWSDYQTQVGTFYEKIWATYYLAEAYDTFISNSKEDFTDSRYKNVSFATVFPNQVRRLYNALLTGDMEAYAPYVVSPDPTGPTDIPLATLQYPAWHGATVPSRPRSAKLVDPNYGWNEQLYAMVWGQVFFPTDWSQSFIHDARIAVKPSETPSWPADETLAFFDPKTGLTYKAHTAGTERVLGNDYEKSAGARMLEYGNKLVAWTYLVETDQDAIVYNADGTPKLILDANGKAQLDPETEGAEAVLRKYVDTIDLFRQLTSTFETPLGDGDLPLP
ncbi:MAG: hypothetical protein QM765_04590 [Myxococcales bacterium]